MTAAATVAAAIGVIPDYRQKISATD